MAPTNLYFSPAVRTEQLLYEDLIIEGLRMYGQETFYIPRTAITSDEILNEDYSRFESAYMIEMYVANTEGFEGEGTLLSKFGLEIRDQATFVLARRRFDQLVSIDYNKVASDRPREGDLIYLPLANSLFEIKFVEHEKPFYRLNDLPTYELQCELYEYSSQRIDTGISEIDEFEREHASKTVLSISGGSTGFAAGTQIYQVVDPGDSDTESIEVVAEVADFVTTQAEDSSVGQEREADLTLVGVQSTDGELRSFGPGFGNLFLLDDESDTGWSVLKEYDLADIGDQYIPDETDEFADNTQFEIDGDQIIDFSESNPFGEVGNTP
jgi:hypothetical protein